MNVNLGIGTTNPSTQLHCTGQITMDGASGTDYVLDVAEVIPVADDVQEGEVVSLMPLRLNINLSGAQNPMTL